MSIFIRLAIVCAFIATAIVGRSEELSIQVKETSDEANGIITQLVISSKPIGQVTKLQYQGIVRDIQYNKIRTICAINFKPGTQVNEVYVLASMPSGEIGIIKNFNDKLKDDFRYDGNILSTDYIHVDHIKDRTLWVSCGAKGESNYSFRVELTERGVIQIMQKSIIKE